MNELEFYPGDAFLASDSPNGKYAAVFEDEGETGYLYAVDLVKQRNREEGVLLDALLIYNVRDLREVDKASHAIIRWHENGLQCALLINGDPHAVLDFEARRGYCRINFPNFPNHPDRSWINSDHAWSEDAATWLTE